MSIIVKGRYRDILYNSQGQMRWDSGWHSNTIVQGCSLLLAALMKGHQGMQGILYWAVGEGEAAWDSRCPTPVSSTLSLFREVARQALSENQIKYIDHLNNPMETASNILRITAEFKGEDLIENGFRCLREFGLFGGDATEEPNSGFMINYVIHPRIDLYNGMNLNRSLHLTFETIPVPLQDQMRFVLADHIKLQ